MSRVLLLTCDAGLQEAVGRVCHGKESELTVWSGLPQAAAGLDAFDLAIVDTRPIPGSAFSFPTLTTMTLKPTAPFRADRILAVAHYQDLVGRMNTFVHGGSSYLRIHAYGSPPEPNLDAELAAGISDALALDPYRYVDFHDAFPDPSFYRDAFESMQVPAVILTPGGVIRLMNLRALAHFNYVTQDVIDQDWSMLIAPADRGATARDVLLRISGGYFYECGLRFVDRHGHAFPALVTSGRVFSEVASDLLIILTFHDLTELEELQRQLNMVQRLESVERVIAGMSHELNNVLTAILGNAELLAEDLPAGSEAREGADVIRREAQRAQGLIGRLLGLSSSRRFAPGPFSCREVVETTVAVMRNVMGERITIETQTLERDDEVVGEANQLQQVLVNLCLNARDAIEGAGRITIRTCAREVTPEECRLRQDWIPGHFVEVAVQDTGHGMTPEVASRAVEPFFTTKDPGAGSGLGLAVVRNIAHSHGGHVALESAPGQGTTVMVRLPQSRSSDVGAPPDEDHIAGTASAHGEWILLVEDEQDSLIYAQKVLERAGYRIRPALHGTLAIDLLDQNRSDIALVILDVTLPGMPGREVLTQLRGRDPRVPVILCSSFADEGLDPRMIEEVQGVLKKPFRSRELLGQVAEVLASARAEH